MSLKHQIARKNVLNAGLAILNSGMVIGPWGNLSMIIQEDELMLITPTGGLEYQDLEADDIPILDFEGNVIEGTTNPSVETPLHLAIYKARPDVQAIIHTHSVYGTAMAIARKPIPAVSEDLIFCVGGSVEVAPYRLPGSEELAAVVVEALKDKNAVLMANHGLVVVGKTLKEALTTAMICEKSAKATLLAANIGGAVALDDQSCQEITAIYNRVYFED